MNSSLEQVNALLASGAVDEAREALRKATAVRVRAAGEHRDWGLLAERLAMDGIAERELNLALRDDPRDHVALGHLIELSLERGALERAANLLERAMDLDPQDADLYRKALDVYETMEAGARAQALRKRAAALGIVLPGPSHEASAPQEVEGEPVVPCDADLVRFLSLFGGREDVYARQWYSAQKGEGGYAPVREPLTARQLRQHFLGDVTLGVYPIRLDGTCLFCALDLDIVRPVLEQARREQELARQVRAEVSASTAEISAALTAAHLPHLIEDSGYKGRHFWFFPAVPEHAATLVALGRAVTALIASHLSPHLRAEWFPKAGGAGAKGLGNLIKLPLGVHRRTGRRSCFVEPGGAPIARPWEAIRSVGRLQRDVILGVIDAARALPQPGGEKLPAADSDESRAQDKPPAVSLPVRVSWTAGDFDASPAFRALLGGCEVLAALRKKAEQERRLTHEEAVVLTHSFGHVPGGVAAVNYLFNLCHNVPRSAFLVSPLRGNPISCAKIRARIPEVTSRFGCACEFPDASEHYPSPVLHLRGLDPAALVPPPAAPAPGDDIRRYLLVRRRIVELEGEVRELHNSLTATLRAVPDARCEIEEGVMCLVEREGVPTLEWTPKEPANA